MKSWLYPSHGDCVKKKQQLKIHQEIIILLLLKDKIESCSFPVFNGKKLGP